MNYRRIFRLIGRILVIEALFMLPAILISLVRGDGAAVRGFAAAMAACVAAGAPLSALKDGSRGFYTRDGLVTAGLAWIAVSVFGALPFIVSGEIPSVMDALFETISGFTTTGASILRDVEALSAGMLYWRSFSHWLGGMGVLVFILAIAPSAKDGSALHLLRAESPGVNVGKMVPRMRNNAAILYGIYFALTLAMLLLLLAGGMPFFDAITMSFGTAGTGGFAIRAAGAAAYSTYSQVVITVFMVLFGVNFNIYYMLLIRRMGKALRNQEFLTYLAVIAASVLLITMNIRSLYAGVGTALKDSAFQVASLVSSTGFATANFDLWPPFSKSILLLLMVMGACAGSTGGGFKVIRILLGVKCARRAVSKALRPNSVKVIHMDGERIDEETASATMGYLLVIAVIILLSGLLIAVDGFSFETNISAVIACVNNIGPGFGSVGPACNFADFSVFSKIILCADMLIGRLEIYPILILLMPSMWRK